MNQNTESTIPDSELIIREGGRVYHLDIAPENIANTIITVGDPSRVSEVSKHFDVITYTGQHREFITHTGTIGNKQVSVISTGIGPDNIDIVWNELDAVVNIDLKTRLIKEKKTQLNIIRLGTCGGLQPSIPVDSIVVSAYGLGLDNLMHYYKHENTPTEAAILAAFNKHTNVNSKNIIPYLFQGSDALLRHFKEEFVTGITVTCPGFYGPQGRILRLKTAVDNLPETLSSFKNGDHRIVNFEMETSAMYGLSQLLGHHSLSISTVVANRTNKTFSADGNKAVNNMIKKCLEIIVAKIA